MDIAYAVGLALAAFVVVFIVLQPWIHSNGRVNCELRSGRSHNVKLTKVHSQTVETEFGTD